jgi:NitT/TauT family transport system substrate-binding protein
VLALGIAFLFPLFAGCSRKVQPPAAEQARKITLAVTPWPASASLYVAHEKGYFRNEGLDATIETYTSGHLGLADMLAGKADFATAGETPMAQVVITGKPLAIVATLCEVDRAILIIARRDRGISARGDLRGKRVGVVAGTTAEFYLHIFLATSRINPADVRSVHIKPEEMVGALVKGEVDAVSTWAPHTLLLRDRLGSNALILDEPALYTMTWNLACTKDFARRNPDVVTRLLRATVAADSFIAEQPGEARRIASRHMGSDSPLFDREWGDYQFATALDQSLVLNMEDQARWMLKAGAGRLPKQPNFLGFIYTDGLSAVQPDAVTITGR